MLTLIPADYTSHPLFQGARAVEQDARLVAKIQAAGGDVMRMTSEQALAAFTEDHLSP